MFDNLVDSVTNRKLPTYWDEDCNMFGKFTVNQMEAIDGVLMKIKKQLQNAKIDKKWDLLPAIFRKYLI